MYLLSDHLMISWSEMIREADIAHDERTSVDSMICASLPVSCLYAVQWSPRKLHEIVANYSSINLKNVTLMHALTVKGSPDFVLHMSHSKIWIQKKSNIIIKMSDYILSTKKSACNFVMQKHVMHHCEVFFSDFNVEIKAIMHACKNLCNFFKSDGL